MRPKLGLVLMMLALTSVGAGCPGDTHGGSAPDGGSSGQGGEAGADPSAGSGGDAGSSNAGSGGGGSGGSGGDADGGKPMITGRTTGEKIDLLFMVDNSHTMREEQAALRAQFPRLIERLIDGVDLDGDGTLEYEGARDVHLGVVSSDLGLPGLEGQRIEGCIGLGDQGLLNNTASPEVTGCSQQTFAPPFLSYVDGTSSPEQTATDFACIATLGTDGCGFEQQLESTLKAVWPGDDMRVTFLTDTQGFGLHGNAGPSFPNGDFIRNDPNDLSLIAIVLVTDEEDCSSRRMDHFIPGASPNGLNTRCYYESLRGADSNLFAVDRYTQLFPMLRPGNEQLVVFGAIVGVPPELVTPEKIAAVDYDDPAAVDAFYDGILAHEQMQYVLDDKGTPEVLDDDGLKASCTLGPEGEPTARAYPPRRIVEVAKSFGRNGFVQSICEDDFVPAIDLIITRIAETFEPVVQ
jgi:hypothetical protein